MNCKQKLWVQIAIILIVEMLLVSGCTTSVPSEKQPASSTSGRWSQIAWGKPVNGICAGIQVPNKWWQHALIITYGNYYRRDWGCSTCINFYIRNKSFKVPQGSDGSARISFKEYGLQNAFAVPGTSRSGGSVNAEKAWLIPKLMDGNVHHLGPLPLDTMEVGLALVRDHYTLPGLYKIDLSGYVKMTFHMTDESGKIISPPIKIKLNTAAAKTSIRIEEEYYFMWEKVSMKEFIEKRRINDRVFRAKVRELMDLPLKERVNEYENILEKLKRGEDPVRGNKEYAAGFIVSAAEKDTRQKHQTKNN
ncbi:hypothetical protein ACFL6F_03120 [Planctomycetota bacterium]